MGRAISLSPEKMAKADRAADTTVAIENIAKLPKLLRRSKRAAYM
jgi:hypothetical protein